MSHISSTRSAPGQLDMDPNGTTGPFTKVGARSPVASLPSGQDGESERPRLTEGTNILSWDCGISNLCYCLIEDLSGNDGEQNVDGRDYRIVMWENFSLNSQTLMQAVNMLVKELDKRQWMMDVDYVCIESQTLKNVQMKVISHSIQCYFETRGEMQARERASYITLANGTRVMRRGPGGPPVNFIKPENKFKAAKDIPIPDSIEKLQRRRRNKKAAVYLAEQILAHKQKDQMALTFLRSFEKKDDLSDSFLQAVYFLQLMRQKRKQNTRLQQYLGIGASSKEAAPKTGKGSRGAHKKRGASPSSSSSVVLQATGDSRDLPITISIEETTGTKDEVFDEGLRVNEGCEYEREVPLPQVYRSEHFSIPVYDNHGSRVTSATKFIRTTRSRDENGHNDENLDP